MAKNAQKRAQYYEAVRDYAQDLLSLAEARIKNIEALGDELAEEFAKIQKRHCSLLDKANRRIARELKKVSAPKEEPVAAEATPPVRKPAKVKVVKAPAKVPPPA